MTATLSVLAVQDRVRELLVIEEAVRLVGTEGGVVSEEDKVVAVTATEGSETFPAASKAETV